MNERNLNAHIRSYIFTMYKYDNCMRVKALPISQLFVEKLGDLVSGAAIDRLSLL